jgi:hypothetical protein
MLSDRYILPPPTVTHPSHKEAQLAQVLALTAGLYLTGICCNGWALSDRRL